VARRAPPVRRRARRGVALPAGDRAVRAVTDRQRVIGRRGRARDRERGPRSGRRVEDGGRVARQAHALAVRRDRGAGAWRERPRSCAVARAEARGVTGPPDEHAAPRGVTRGARDGGAARGGDLRGVRRVLEARGGCAGADHRRRGRRGREREDREDRGRDPASGARAPAVGAPGRPLDGLAPH
jgi:hypothetical protein